MSWQLHGLDLWLRRFEKPRLARAVSLADARARLERAARLAPGQGAWRPVAGGLALAGPAGGPLLFWLHGGGFCLGSPRTHAAMVAALAGRARAGAVMPDYRLAPEHPFPAALDDAEAAWDALVGGGQAPGRVVLGGDSAGGGLAFALLGRLLAAGGPLPGGVVAFSPWVDLTLSGASLVALADRDALLPASRLAEVRALYLAGADPRDPAASPHLGRFLGAPPVLIQASAAEILRDDARAMAGRLADDGATVRLELVPGVPHVWQAFHAFLPEARAALDRAANFVRRTVGDGGAGVR